jgi:hypothetical protein
MAAAVAFMVAASAEVDFVEAALADVASAAVVSRSAAIEADMVAATAATVDTAMDMGRAS